MPLEILLALVIGGIGTIATILHLTGRSAPAVLNCDAARRAWQRHFPADTIREVIPARNGHAALVLTSAGPGVIWAFGADTVARHLLDFSLHDVPDGLRLAFRDFGTPGVSLTLTDAERARWRQLMTSR